MKPNREELAATVKRPLETDDELVRAMREIIDLGAQWVLVTQEPTRPSSPPGPRSTAFSRRRSTSSTRLAAATSVAAGIAVGIADDQPVVEAVRYGLAAAADNATRLLPARLDGKAVDSTA